MVQKPMAMAIWLYFMVLANSQFMTVTEILWFQNKKTRHDIRRQGSTASDEFIPRGPILAAEPWQLPFLQLFYHGRWTGQIYLLL